MKTKFLLLALLSMLISCKKETKEDEPSTTISESDRLTMLKAGHWHEYKYTVVSDGTPTDKSYLTCHLDDYLVFTSNTEYSFNEGATSCTPSNAKTSTWSLSSDEQKITFATEQYSITKLKTDSLDITRYDPESGLRTYIYFENIK